MNPRLQLIVKNTAFLYVRLLFVMVVSLYISRVLLQMLGVDDFGIYSVVGSITGMFASIKSVFAEATQRYINNAKGKGDGGLAQRIFSTSLILHLFVGVIFVIIVLIVGEVLLNNTLNIPVGREHAAHTAFYFSILSIFIIILTIPYDAAIMANERINVYSIVSIIDSILKLIIVLILPLFNVDNLILYTMLLCLVSLFTLVVYLIYTKRFSECKVIWKIDKSLVSELGVFSLWNFIGNFIFSIVHEAYNMLLNVFGGVASNAARSIAYQVRSAVSSFTNNALVAVKPFVMQETASNEKKRIFDYILRISSFTFYMSLVISIPIITCSSDLLQVWLGNVPEGASIFTQLVVFALLIRSLHGPLSLMFISFAKIKRATIGEAIIYLLSVFVVYVMLRAGLPLWSMFAFLCVVEAACILTLSYIAQYDLEFNVSDYHKLLIKLAFVMIFTIACALGMVYLLNTVIVIDGILVRLLIDLVLSMALTLCVIYIFMSAQEKNVIHNLLRHFLRKNEK